MERFEKQHSIVLTEVFNSRSELDAHEAECSIYRAKFDEIKRILITERPDGCMFYGTFGSFCPYIQHITFDALKKEDWPHNISDNSIFLRFDIDFKGMTVKCERYGHIYLTSEDQKKSYLAMCSMKKIHEHMGERWMRKSKFKNARDLVAKMNRFYENVMVSVTKATGGYPYKQMIMNVY